MTEDKLLTPPQVAQRLQVNERTVTQWLRRGLLRGFKIGKEWLQNREGVARLVARPRGLPGTERQRSHGRRPHLNLYVSYNAQPKHYPGNRHRGGESPVPRRDQIV